MTELSNLIEAASHANNGRSMQAAADLATRLGFPISKSHISKNIHRIVSITPQLVRGIAAGYGVSEEDVVRAALADLGFAIMDYNPSPESAIRRDPNLSMQARAMLLAALQAARARIEDGPSGAGRRVVARSRVAEDESQEFAILQPEPLGDADAGEVAGEDRQQYS